MTNLIVAFHNFANAPTNVSENSCIENQNSCFMFHRFFPKIMPFMRQVEKYGTATQATDDI